MPDRFDWARLGWTCLACMLLMAFGAACGYLAAHVRLADQLDAAHIDAKSCASTADAKQAAIDKLTKASRKRGRQLAALRDQARAALAARDALQQQLTAATRQRQQQVKETVHAHADCQALAGLPLCPAVAHRLFAPGQGIDPTAGDHRDP